MSDHRMPDLRLFGDFHLASLLESQSGYVTTDAGCAAMLEAARRLYALAKIKPKSEPTEDGT